MKTPGILREPLFYLRILTITSVLSISLQISQTIASTSVENTFGSLELQKEKNEKSNQNLIGRGIMGPVQNLKKTFSSLVDKILVALSCQYIKHLAKQTTKKQDNSSQTESSQSPLTTESQNTTIVTSSQDTSEKTITIQETEDIIGHVRTWSLDKFNENKLPVKDSLALYQEFAEWIELNDEEFEVISLDQITREQYDDFVDYSDGIERA